MMTVMFEVVRERGSLPDKRGMGAIPRNQVAHSLRRTSTKQHDGGNYPRIGGSSPLNRLNTAQTSKTAHRRTKAFAKKSILQCNNNPELAVTVMRIMMEE